MMSPKRLTLATASALLITSSIQSQVDPFAEETKAKQAPRMIRVQAEFIEMPHATHTRLMAKPRATTNDADLRATCAELVEAGEARVIESLSVTALPGQITVTESISEHIYPTELDPPALPNKVAAVTPPIPDPKIPPGNPPAPSAFETRNVGSTLEVEAVILDDFSLPIVDLRLAPSIVYYEKENTWNKWSTDEVSIDFRVPQFFVLQANTGTTVVSGQPQMMATLSPQNENGFTDTSRKIMLFVRADILSVDQ
jgi:hypothetical protein